MGYLGLALEEAGAELRVRRAGPETSPADLTLDDDVDGVVVLGGIVHPRHGEGYEWLEAERELIRAADRDDLPLIGVCLGSQLIAQAHGGDSVAAATPEIGWLPVELLPGAERDPLLAGAPWPPQFLLWHHWEIEPPADAEVLARSEACIQVIRAGSSTWGFQFHFEADPSIAASWVAAERAEDGSSAQGRDSAGRPYSSSEGFKDPFDMVGDERLRDERCFAGQREFSRHIGTRFVELVRSRASA